jgi:hypothetical protein
MKTIKTNQTVLKILVVCSGLDFINYTRRATIESIHKLHPDTEVLMFNSVLNIRRQKKVAKGIKFHFYHFWVVEGLRKYRILGRLEYYLRSFSLKKFFTGYDTVFLIDPNQYYLLPYLGKEQKLVYLLRDPSVLMNAANFSKELPIIKRADLILGISRNLCTYYFERYYGFIPDSVKLWSNTADTDLWDYNSLAGKRMLKERPTIGLAGNLTYVIDIELLRHVAEGLPGYDLEIAGRFDLEGSDKDSWDELVKLPNVKYLGYIPFNDFPSVVINWNVGLVAAKPDHEFARYLNNNKQYQYIALGKPFVTYHLNADYDEFEDFVFIAGDRDEYIKKIREAYSRSVSSDMVPRGLEIVSRHSAEKRAQQFLEYLAEIN